MTDVAHAELGRKIEACSARIGILGLGYVGLPLAKAFCEAGFAVNGFDVDTLRCEALNAGQSPLKHIENSEIACLVEDGVFFATDDFKLLRRMDIAIICVPTPLTAAREPDLSYVEAATREIQRYMNPGTLVVLESTTYPGTTQDVVRPILEQSGLYCGEDFYLAFSPEREDPGNAHYNTRTIPKLVGGVEPQSGRLASMLYRCAVGKVIEVESASIAEAAKVLENIYRCVNIAMVNELKVLFDRMDIDIWKVIEAASSKPFGFQAFYPGPGLGGHCIPIDPFYLSWRARQYDIPTRFIELAGEINTAMPEYVVTRLGDALNQRRKALNGSRVLLLGVAYKRDVEDVRESPALRLLALLQEKGVEVSYHDPFVPTLSAPSLPSSASEMQVFQSVDLCAEVISQSDAVLIVTDHSAVDYGLIQNHAELVVDTRNAMNLHGVSSSKVVKA